jgi:hypothetical protein
MVTPDTSQLSLSSSSQAFPCISCQITHIFCRLQEQYFGHGGPIQWHDNYNPLMDYMFWLGARHGLYPQTPKDCWYEPCASALVLVRIRLKYM